MKEPLAQGVVGGLKSRILSGALASGSKLPSEAELVAEFEVSRTVVRAAVSRLQAESLVETFQGRGSFVVALPEPTTFTWSRLRSAPTVTCSRCSISEWESRVGQQRGAAAPGDITALDTHWIWQDGQGLARDPLVIRSGHIRGSRPARARGGARPRPAAEAHELYVEHGLGARDDSAAMQYLVEGWAFDPKRPALVR